MGEYRQFKIILKVTMTPENDWRSIAERELEVTAPYNSLQSFGYNCGDVVKSLIHVVLGEGLDAHNAKEPEDAD